MFYFLCVFNTDIHNDSMCNLSHMPKWNYFVCTVLVWHLATLFVFCFSSSAEALSVTMLTVENGILHILL